MNPLTEFYNLHLHYTVNQRLFEDRCRQLLHFKGTLDERQQLVDDTLRLSLAVTDTIDEEEAIMADTIEYIQTNEIDGGADILEAMSLVANNLKEDRARATSYSNLITRRKLGQTGQRVRQPQIANPYVPIQKQTEEAPQPTARIEDYEQTEGTDGVICPNCGHVNRGANNFCTACGLPFKLKPVVEPVERSTPTPKPKPTPVPVERDLFVNEEEEEVAEEEEPEEEEVEEEEVEESEPEVSEEVEEEEEEEQPEPKMVVVTEEPEGKPGNVVYVREDPIDPRAVICDFCGKEIKSNNELVVVDGKPVHIHCRYKMLTAGMPKQGQPEVSGDGFNGYGMDELGVLAEESRQIMDGRIQPPEPETEEPMTRKEKRAAKKTEKKAKKTTARKKTTTKKRGLFGKKKADETEE